MAVVHTPESVLRPKERVVPDAGACGGDADESPGVLVPGENDAGAQDPDAAFAVAGYGADGKNGKAMLGRVCRKAALTITNHSAAVGGRPQLAPAIVRTGEK